MHAATIAAILALPLSIAAPRAQDAAPATQTAAKGDAKWAEGPAIPKLRFVRLFPNLALVRPIQTLQAKGDANGLLLVEQPGRILRADLTAPDAADAPVFLDIRERVHDGGNEEGLLSIAFHPDYPAKRELFVYYTAKDPRRSKLSRFTVAADGLSADPASEETLLEQSQPYSNHNGGAAVFGPDGFLYLSLGDGGAANDPHHYAQDLSTYLGKVLRIDVNAKSEGLAYAVPSDNPFVGREGAKPEIWAYGTRNIWRMAFDPKTGDLWAGDVGQNIWEEVDLIVKGGNYGWNAREGAHDFKGGKGEPPFIEPVVEYSHREGMSITGGRVYRGAASPALDGVYIYADFISSNVWGIRMIDGKPTKPAIVARKRGDLIASIDELHDGTLVVSSFDQDQKRGNPGSIWKLVAAE
ncbi:MAG: Soluble aldose sugar dehydrogenase YliI precursor [Planctomycetota bacterium]